MNSLSRRLLKGLAVVYLIYLAISLLIVLPALNIAAPRLVRDSINRELSSELLLFNPFTLAVEARGIALTEDDGHRPLAFKRLLIDLSLSSLWREGIVLDRVWLDELDLHVLRYDDGGFHFDDLLGADDTPEPTEEATPIPAFTIKDIRLGAHTLAYTDRTRPGPYRTVQEDLKIEIEDLSTVPGSDGDSELELISDGGGRLSWDGKLDLAAMQSNGRLVLENIDLSPAWRYEAERLAFVVNSARFDLEFRYRADWARDVALNLDALSLRLHSIDLSARDTEAYPDTFVRLQELLLSGGEMNLAEQSAGAERLALSGLELSGFDEGDTVSLRDIFLYELEETDEPAEDEEVDAPAPAAEEKDDATADSEWTVSLDEFSLAESGVSWATPLLQPERMEVRPLNAGASGLAWPASDASDFSLDLGINAVTRVNVSAAVHLGSGDGGVRANLTGLPLPWINPVVHEQLRTDIASGTFNLDSELELSDFGPARAGFNAEVTELGTVLHETGDEAFKLQRFAVEGGELDMAAETLRIANVLLDAPAGSLHIGEDGQINVNGVLRERPDVAQSAEVSAEDSEESNWRVIIDRVALAGGRLDFADDSLPLPFRTMIENMEAEIVDIDSMAETPLSVTLNGNVDGYAPVVIEGGGTPHGAQPDAEISFRFRGVDIATMSPYSGTYAGYAIDSGTLSLDLRYALAGQALDGNNRIVISQMKLGEPVESELAVEVPLKLGLALLTDAQGVIDLEVPVSGNVDDPQFSLGKVIGRAVMNIITKAVTAPFKLLAGLVGSEADLENLAFAAGSTELDAIAQSALGDLSRALQERPQLQLRVGGSADPVADGDILRRQSLEQALIDEGLDPLALENRDERWSEAVGVRFAALNEAAAADQEDAAQAEDSASEPPSVDAMWEALIAATPLSPEALETLGNERAAEAKRYLVTEGGIDAARIAISYDLVSQDSAAHMEIGS